MVPRGKRVSVNYELLVDGNFVRGQLGQKKIPETLQALQAQEKMYKVYGSGR